MRFTTFFTVIVAAILIGNASYGQEPSSRSGLHAYGDSDFRLGPDDVIEVFVYKEPELSVTVVVRPDGRISLPLIGELQASSKTALELQDEVRFKLKKYISEPVVNVIVKEVNSAKVSVLGEVKTPGMYKIKDKATVLDAIALAGGFTEYAKRDKVIVIRSDASGGQKPFKVNVNDQIKGDRREPFYVLPYDKIYVQ